MTPMPSFRNLIRSAQRGAIHGAIACTLVSTICMLAGLRPSFLPLWATSQTLIVTGLGLQALHYRRKWQHVLALYNQPALGEGIQTPHRPPADPTA